MNQNFSIRTFPKNELLASNWQRKPDLKVISPGRINLIGEHTDYNGGQVLPCAISAAITILSSTSTFKDDAKKSTISLEGFSKFEDLAISIRLPAAATPRENAIRSILIDPMTPQWAKYALGAVHFAFGDIDTDSIEIRFEIDSTIPAGGGLSSSAALALGLLITFAPNPIEMRSRKDFATLAMLIEHEFIGTKCGMMDQMAIVHGCRDHFVHIDFCSPDRPKFELVPAAPLLELGYDLLAIDTGVKHSLAHSPYNSIRRDCEDALQILNGHFGTLYTSLGALAKSEEFRSATTFDVKEQRKKLKEYLEKILTNPAQAARASHAMTENHRVEAACHGLRAANVQEIHLAMSGSHTSLSRDYQVSSPELDFLVDLVGSWSEQRKVKQPGQLPAVIGSRMTGGGFGGSTVQWIHQDAREDFERYMESESNSFFVAFGHRAKLLNCNPQDGIQIKKLF